MKNRKIEKGVRVAIDIGGTFTDAVAIKPDGEILTAKASTTPKNLTEGVLNAVRDLEIEPQSVTSFIHGTTAGLNALLERRGANVALLTTKGFRDIYEIGRSNRPDMYNARYKRPLPLVRRRNIYEIDERIAADGSLIRPINSTEIRALYQQSLEGNYDAIAVCLLHSYRNSSNEKALKEILIQELPDIHVILSSDVAPEWREYERTSTTVVSAYVAPIVEEYLSNLEDRLKKEGINCPVLVMQSNGGVVSAQVARHLPVQTLLSGPVGGTTAGVAVEKSVKKILEEGLICVDMGGTSFDVSMVVDGAAQIELEASLDGHDLLFPAVAIHTVGAGGGSVAETSSGGLRVGPRSAGAMPGPACYSRGGNEPTVTDANLILGRISTEARLSGDLQLDLMKAKDAVDRVGQEIELEKTALSEGIVRIADSNMANAIRELTVFRGIDPRNYALMAFGGAGPLHAVALAEELEISTVIVPAYAGVLSAWGMLQADYRVDRSISHSGILGDLQDEFIIQTTQMLSTDAQTTLNLGQMPDTQYEEHKAADLRYLGQEYTLTVPIENLNNGWQNELRKRFDDAYMIRFGHCNRDETVEIVNLRVTVTIPNQPISHNRIKNESASNPISYEKSWSGNEWVDTPVYQRDNLKEDDPISGPAMILEPDATTYIPSGWQLQMHNEAHLLITRIDS